MLLQLVGGTLTDRICICSFNLFQSCSCPPLSIQPSVDMPCLVLRCHPSPRALQQWRLQQPDSDSAAGTLLCCRLFDVDGNGRVDARELFFGLILMQPNTPHSGPIGTARLRMIFDLYDTDHSGSIEVSEFRRYCCFLHRLTSSAPRCLSLSCSYLYPRSHPYNTAFTSLLVYRCSHPQTADFRFCRCPLSVSGIAAVPAREIK